MAAKKRRHSVAESETEAARVARGRPRVQFSLAQETVDSIDEIAGEQRAMGETDSRSRAVELAVAKYLGVDPPPEPER